MIYNELQGDYALFTTIYKTIENYLQPITILISRLTIIYNQ